MVFSYKPIYSTVSLYPGQFTYKRYKITATPGEICVVCCVFGVWSMFCLYIMMTSWNGTVSALLAICAGNSPVPVEFPAQRPVSQFSLIYVWINGWVNNREAGDLRRNSAHYDVIVMCSALYAISCYTGLCYNENRLQDSATVIRVHIDSYITPVHTSPLHQAECVCAMQGDISHNTKHHILSH